MHAVNRAGSPLVKLAGYVFHSEIFLSVQIETVAYLVGCYFSEYAVTAFFE